MPVLKLVAAAAFAALLCGTIQPSTAFAAAPKPVADFTLQPVNGTEPFTLSKAAGKPVALHFLLKTECPICIRLTTEFTRRAPELKGVTQVFIKPDDPETTKKWLASAGEGAPVIYTDPNAALAKTLGIKDGYQFHGEVVHYPAFILINAKGEEVFRHVGKSNTDRISFMKAQAELAKVTAPARNIREYNLPKSLVAVDGFDLVTYHSEARPLPGKKDITTVYDGVTYQFTTEADRTAFLATPEKYLPTFGGWCATAMVDGSKVSVDPKNYKVTNGRLFLFYNGILGNAKDGWDDGEDEKIMKADAAWKSISAE